MDYTTNSNILSNINTKIKQPSLSPGLAFLSKWGADLLVSGSFIANSDDSLQNSSLELDIMLGYSLKVHKNLTLYPSYTHFLYSKNANFFNSVFHSDVRLDLDYNYRFIGMGLTSGYLIGKQQTFYAAFRNYYTISFNKFKADRGSLNIQPGADLNFGNYEYLNLLYLDQLRQEPRFYYYIYKGSPVLYRYYLAARLKNPGLTFREFVDDLLENQAEDTFKISSLNFSLPMFYMIGNFGINLGIFISIPLNPPEYLSNEALFYFNAGVSYSF